MDSSAIVSGPHAEAFLGGSGYNYGYPDGVTLPDMVPDHIRPMIHPHWNNFPPVNPMWHYLLGTTYIILGTLAFLGNALVMKLYLTDVSLRSPSNLLVFNLALSDLLMVLSQFPLYIYNCFNGGQWLFSPFLCELYACLGGVTGIASLWSLVFISYDRYNVIVKGMSGTPLTSARATLYSAFCWLYAIAWTMPPFFGWGRYIPEGILSSCSFDYLTRDTNLRSFGVSLFVSSYVVPLGVISFAYVFIVKAIVSHEKSMREQAKKMNVSSLRSTQDTRAQSAEVRIAKVSLTNVALWLICWTPYACIVIQGLFFDQSTITPIVSMLPALLCKTAAVYNPMVYAINHPKFRLALQKNMPWFCIHEDDVQPETKSSVSTDTTVKESEAG